MKSASPGKKECLYWANSEQRSHRWDTEIGMNGKSYQVRFPVHCRKFLAVELQARQFHDALESSLNESACSRHSCKNGSLLLPPGGTLGKHAHDPRKRTLTPVALSAADENS